MTVPVTTMPQLEQLPFSRMLRESTKKVHHRANHSSYMDALLGGVLTLDEYARLVTQYYFIYQALEQASDAMETDPVGEKFVFNDLRRLPALAQDLEFLLGPQWESTITALPSTQDYVQRIHQVAFAWPGGFVAHHYTRYLGDIAGGQIIRRLLAQQYGIDRAGSYFYHFDRIGSAPAFRDHYRALLDNAPWDQEERQRVLDEAAIAFEHNITVLAELAEELTETL